jgi:hypothetical protein
MSKLIRLADVVDDKISKEKEQEFFERTSKIASQNGSSSSRNKRDEHNYRSCKT